MEIRIRPFIRERDAGFIYGTFPRGLYFSVIKPQKKTPYKEFITTFSVKLEGFLANAEIFVACSKDDNDYLVGYCIIHNHELQWIFIKNGFRNNGLATLLTKNKQIESVNEHNLTRSGREILERRNYPFKKKEEIENEVHK